MKRPFQTVQSFLRSEECDHPFSWILELDAMVLDSLRWHSHAFSYGLVEYIVQFVPLKVEWSFFLSTLFEMSEHSPFDDSVQTYLLERNVVDLV